MPRRRMGSRLEDQLLFFPGVLRLIKHMQDCWLDFPLTFTGGACIILANVSLLTVQSGCRGEEVPGYCD